MTPGQRISVYLDDARLGCGYRRLLVLEVGRKWAVLFHLPTLRTIRLPIEQLKRNRTYREIDGNRRTLRRLIKAELATRKRLGLPYSNSGTKAALELLA